MAAASDEDHETALESHMDQVLMYYPDSPSRTALFVYALQTFKPNVTFDDLSFAVFWTMCRKMRCEITGEEARWKEKDAVAMHALALANRNAGNFGVEIALGYVYEHTNTLSRIPELERFFPPSITGASLRRRAEEARQKQPEPPAQDAKAELDRILTLCYFEAGKGHTSFFAESTFAYDGLLAIVAQLRGLDICADVVCMSHANTERIICVRGLVVSFAEKK